MKKITLLLAVSLFLATAVSAQNADLKKWANKTQGKSTVVNQQDKVQANSQVNDYALLMEKSTKLQYGALTCAGLGTGLSIAGALISTKKYGDENSPIEELQKVNDQANSDRKLRKGLFIGAGLSFATALCLEWASLDYKLKAGRTLRIFSNGTGTGLAYSF